MSSEVKRIPFEKLMELERHRRNGDAVYKIMLMHFGPSLIQMAMLESRRDFVPCTLAELKAKIPLTAAEPPNWLLPRDGKIPLCKFFTTKSGTKADQDGTVEKVHYERIGADGSKERYSFPEQGEGIPLLMTMDEWNKLEGK